MLTESQRTFSYWVLMANLFTVFTQFSFPVVYFSVISKEQGLNEYTTGVIYSFYSVGAIMMLLLIMTCRLREKVSVNKLNVMFEVLEVGAAVLMAFSTSFGDQATFCRLSTLSRFLQGLGQGGVASINYSYVMLLRPNDIQANVSKYELSTCLGYIFGSQLAILLHQLFQDYFYMNLALAALLFLVGALQVLCFLLNDLQCLELHQHSQREQEQEIEEESKRPNAEVVVLILLFMTSNLTFTFPTSFYSAYLKLELDYSDLQVGFVYTVMGVGNVVGATSLLTKWLSQARLRKGLTLLGQVTCSVFLFFTVSQEALGLAWTRHCIATSSFLMGIAQSMTMNLFIPETIAVYGRLGRQGQKVNDFIANIQIFLYNLCELFGPPTGGVFFYLFGFVNGINIFILLSLPLSFIYYHKYYHNNHDSNQDSQMEMQL